MNDPTMKRGASIFLALRFHVNFYHSYRGDSLDERGIGKDIRIIRGILDDLDRLAAEGVPVKGTWDIENYYSMETMMPASAPDLLSRIAARVRAGLDEAEPMSYNNGIVSASTDEEFAEQLSLMKSNSGGSGLDDVFGSWAPIVRPQECMYTPSFLSRYPAGGIDCVSLYYSAVPFNGFSTLIRPLPFEARYNPGTLRSRSLPGSMTILPCYNDGDVADHCMSLRSWIAGVRRRQLRMDEPRDLILVLDHDADDQFWAGFDVPILSSLVPSFGGLYRLVRSVASLPYLRFATPGEYLKGHGPVGDVYLDQDTADGSFDGYSSWAEKWENAELWTKIQASRNAAACATLLAGSGAGGDAGPIAEALRTSLRERLLAMSTTHFGMASPVMNRKRLSDGHARADAALAAAETALAAARAASAGYREPTLVFPKAMGGRAEGVARLSGQDASALPPGSAMSWAFRGERHAFVPCSLEPGERTAKVPQRMREPLRSGSPLAPSMYSIKDPWIRYGRSIEGASTSGAPIEVALEGGGKALTIGGAIDLGGAGGGTAGGEWVRAELSIPGSRARIIDLEVSWPSTADRGWDEGKSRRLDRRWDARWRELAPLEIVPDLQLAGERCFTIWKRNFFGEVSSYVVDYHLFSRNRAIPSFNNHITDGWVAVGDGERGIVVAQHEGLPNNFAFCPMRQVYSGGRRRLRLNPFGTYYGPQWRYPTATTGLGRALALRMADQLDSYASSYNGKKTRFSVAIFEFEGTEPPADLLAEAALYASAPILARV